MSRRERRPRVTAGTRHTAWGTRSRNLSSLLLLWTLGQEKEPSEVVQPWPWLCSGAATQGQNTDAPCEGGAGLSHSARSDCVCVCQHLSIHLRSCLSLCCAHPSALPAAGECCPCHGPPSLRCQGIGSCPQPFCRTRTRGPNRDYRGRRKNRDIPAWAGAGRAAGP